MSLVRDLQFSLRQLRKAKMFAVVAVVTLALGIGCNTAIFSVFYGVLLCPLPFQDPDRLVLDFAGSHLKTTENHIASDFEPVRAIRLGQFTPETSRIVIDLSEPARYGITAKGNTVTVTLSPRP